MPFAALVMLVAIQAPALPEPPIVVTGRGGVPFISPMGEPIRARSPNEDTLARWFAQVDTNRDGALTPDEMMAYAARYFTVLDTNQDGQIDPDELVRYEWQVAPEIQVDSRLRRARGAKESKAERRDRERDESGGFNRNRDRFSSTGPQGAARYALLNIPEPVAAADADLNRAISLAEFRQAALDRFRLLDTKHTGRLTLPDLEALKPVLTKKVRRRENDPDTRVGVPLPPGP